MPHAPCGMRWIVLPENLGVKKKNGKKGREYLVPSGLAQFPAQLRSRDCKVL
jgi:hypothetical protein